MEIFWAFAGLGSLLFLAFAGMGILAWGMRDK